MWAPPAAVGLLDSNADTCIVSNNCYVIHDHNGPVTVYSYNPNNRHRSVKTINAAVSF